MEEALPDLVDDGDDSSDENEFDFGENGDGPSDVNEFDVGGQIRDVPMSARDHFVAHVLWLWTTRALSDKGCCTVMWALRRSRW